jgi:hypothetical protein
MTTQVLPSAGAGQLFGRSTALPLWGWYVLAFAVIAIRAWFTTGSTLHDVLGDTDDAARLVQVRAFMLGAPWYDTTTMTMGGTSGMLSHWSRFIDLPLAAMIASLSAFMPGSTAELIVRAVWPLMVLAPLLWVMLRTVTTTAGEQAGRIVLALAILSPLGLYQFDAGRIDHHNVMIAATVSAALLMWAYPTSHAAWRLAGALSGLALTIGFEALAPVAALATFAAFWGLMAAPQAPLARNYTAALVLSIAAGFILSIPPSRWMDVYCDATSINLVALSTIAGCGLIIALAPDQTWSRNRSLAKRFAIAAAFAAAGLIVYAKLQPACLAGPMGQLPSELKPIWLDYVAETRSIVRDLINGKIEQSLGLVVFFALGLASQVYRAVNTPKLAEIFLLAALVAFTFFACWQNKYLSYASFLALAPIACWIATLRDSEHVSALVKQAFLTILISQAWLLSVSSLLQKAIGGPVVVTEAIRTGAEACETNTSVSELAALPPGLIAAHIDLGAYITAVTPHRVLSAPYHRIANAIITNHHIFSARTAADAAHLIAREGIDYVVTCKGLDDPFVGEPEWQGTFRADLVAARVPAFLEPVKLDNPKTLFSVWRVNRDKLNPQP